MRILIYPAPNLKIPSTFTQKRVGRSIFSLPNHANLSLPHVQSRMWVLLHVASSNGKQVLNSSARIFLTNCLGLGLWGGRRRLKVDRNLADSLLVRSKSPVFWKSSGPLWEVLNVHQPPTADRASHSRRTYSRSDLRPVPCLDLE